MVNYDAYASTFSQSRKNLHWGELDAIIEDIQISRYTDILDVGCGNGRFLEQMNMKTDKKNEWIIINYLGLDNSIGMITEARKLHPESVFAVCPMESLRECDKLRESKFDAIIFLASFHHLDSREERLKVLRDIQEYLTSSSVIYMTNWNLREQTKYEKSHRWDGDYDIKIGEFSRYYHGFTIDELTLLFEETGYTILENKIFEWGRNIWSKITPLQIS